MGIGTGAAAIIGGIGAAGSIGGAAISSNAAGNAANDQAQAAEQSANLQYQASQNALGFQENQWNTEQNELQPWLQSGTGALGNLDYLLGVGPQTSQQFLGSPTASANLLASGGNPFSAQGTAGLQTSSPSANGLIPQQNVQGAPQSSLAVNPNNPAYNGGLTASGSPLTPTATNGLTPAGSPLGGLTQAPGGTPAFNTAGLPTVGTGQAGPGQPTANAQAGSVGLNPGGLPGSGSRGVTSLTPGAPATPQGGNASLNPGQLPGAGTPGVIGLNGASASSPGAGYGSLLSAYPGQFQAPTAQQALNSPGEQAQLQLGEQALQQSAAARGNLLTGGTAQGLNAYAQDLASTNYQNVYNNSLNTYATNYNQYEQQQANEYNRLASLAGVGQTAAGQLGTLGQAASNNVSSNLLGTAQGIGQATQNAAAANASGLVGSASAINQGIGGATGSLSNMLLLQQLTGGGGSGGGITSQDAATILGGGQSYA